MDITHTPRYITCDVCLQKSSEEFMAEIDGFTVHWPECVDELTKLEERRNKNGNNLVE